MCFAVRDDFKRVAKREVATTRILRARKSKVYNGPMHAIAHDSVSKLVPGGTQSLSHLSDSELLESTRRLVGRSNQLFAALLVHLAEVETRGLHRTRSCASLYTYCIYELRFSEDEAARRAGAAKLVKRFPVLFDAIANGELHLTGLLMLGPHLTLENHLDVLARAKFRTKKEIAKLVRTLAPLPLVPDVIEPLRPAPKAPRNPTWEEFVTSLCPPVRELRPGERPKDWANDSAEAEDQPGVSVHAPARVELVGPAAAGVSPVEAASAELPPLTPPLQYQMQFSTVEEHVQLVERAKALLARERQGVGLGELHLQAMRLLVAALEKQKFAVTDRARERKQAAADATKPAKPNELANASQKLAKRSRHVSAAVRRAVFERDGRRCTHVDERGVRCRETSFLELHHLKPFAKLGESTASNLTLRCSAHNALAAEQDFGAERIIGKRESKRHHSLNRETAASAPLTEVE